MSMTGGSQRNGADSLFLQCHALRLAALQLHFLCRRQLEACPVVRQTVANRPPDHGSSQTCRSTIGGTSFLPPPTFVPSSPIILIFTSKYLHRDRHLAANKSCRYIRL